MSVAPCNIIPVFIAHEGCPHQCVFCNQHAITGSRHSSKQVGSADVSGIIEEWLPRFADKKKKVQVAFYGGSFTGLHLSRQKDLLEAVQSYIKKGVVSSIRLSTRPDDNGDGANLAATSSRIA